MASKFSDATDQRVGVQEDTLGVLGETPAVQLGEGEAEVRSGEQGKVLGVSTVEDVHLHHGVKRVQQLVSAHQGLNDYDRNIGTQQLHSMGANDFM